MTHADRELLALAAKAAGKTRGEWDAVWLRDLGHNISGAMLWNPIEDDGASRRLQVSLRIDIEFCEDESGEAVQALSICPHTYQVVGQRIVLAPGLDPGEAVRRTVLGVAAEIGKAMP